MTFYSVIDSKYETINIKIENENELNRREIQKLQIDINQINSEIKEYN